MRLGINRHVRATGLFAIAVALTVGVGNVKDSVATEHHRRHSRFFGHGHDFGHGQLFGQDRRFRHMRTSLKGRKFGHKNLVRPGRRFGHKGFSRRDPFGFRGRRFGNRHFFGRRDGFVSGRHGGFGFR